MGPMSWYMALLLKPFIALVIFGLVCLPIRLAVQRWMKNGDLKRLLLTPLGDDAFKKPEANRGQITGSIEDGRW